MGRATIEIEQVTFRIPRHAWLMQLVTVAAAWVLFFVLPGPFYEGCLHSKGCFITPELKAYVWGGALLFGGALATWIGGIPRHWITGWSAATAGLATAPLLIFPFIASIPRSTLGRELLATIAPREILILFALSLCTLWLLSTGVGLLASALPSPFARRIAPVATLSDDRPRWLMETSGVIAAIEGGRARRPLTPAESQLAGQLALMLETETDVPRAIVQMATRLRSILAQDEHRAATRAAVIQALREAMTLAVPADPYRVE